MRAAAANTGNRKEVMALLLNRQGDEITIIDKVVKAIAANIGYKQEVMAFLLK
jgi:hypothetical protein